MLSAADVFQRVEIPSSFNPVGSGARALGMGGAFIAVADDATAASWNPGGLIQIENPELSFVYDIFYRREENEFAKNPEASGNASVFAGAVNYFSAAYPFEMLERNMIVSINYQRLYDFTREWDFSLFSQSRGLSRNERFRYTQEGNLSAIGLAYALQITPRFSIGVTLNIWNDELTPNNWEQTIVQYGNGEDDGDPFSFASRTEDRYFFKGINANLGILWNPFTPISIGFVLKTPFEANLEHEQRFSSIIYYPEFPLESEPEMSEFKQDETLEMPLSLGIGIAYRFSGNFTASFDIYRTQWNDFTLTDSGGKEVSPITGKPRDESDIVPTHQVRLGAEYLLITDKHIIPFTGGIFYDPAPAGESPDNIYGFSLGSGLGFGRFHFDFAYQYRFGNDVAEYIFKEKGFSMDINEHTLYLSVVAHF